MSNTYLPNEKYYLPTDRVIDGLLWKVRSDDKRGSIGSPEWGFYKSSRAYFPTFRRDVMTMDNQAFLYDQTETFACSGSHQSPLVLGLLIEASVIDIHNGYVFYDRRVGSLGHALVEMCFVPLADMRLNDIYRAREKYGDACINNRQLPEYKEMLELMKLSEYK